MARVRKGEWGSLVDAAEAPHIFRQPKPEIVEIDDHQIRVLTSPLSDALPLKDSDLFMSFAKLTAHGEPTEAKIKRWVHRFGLPKWGTQGRLNQTEVIGKEDIDYPDGSKGARLTLKLPPPVVDCMPVRDFIKESRYAHELLSVYLDYRGHNYAALRARVAAPESKLDREFSYAYVANRKKWGLWAGRGASQEARDGATWLTAQCATGDLVNGLVEGVRLRVGIQQMTGPVPSWECPNLASAIYLQFYWLVTQNKPIRHCEYCGQAFELTRDDKNVCDGSCRSGLKYRRDKMLRDGDTD